MKCVFYSFKIARSMIDILFVNFEYTVPLTNRGVLLSTLLQDILHPSHHLLNVLLQTANKLGLSLKKKLFRLSQKIKVKIKTEWYNFTRELDIKIKEDCYCHEMQLLMIWGYTMIYCTMKDKKATVTENPRNSITTIILND
jgi:hypothetical protein